MIYLQDLTDGETSDTNLPPPPPPPPIEEEEEDDPVLTSLTNTLETMSAKSFGFVKPNGNPRDNNRVKRHKSFFTPNNTGFHDENMEQMVRYENSSSI